MAGTATDRKVIPPHFIAYLDKHRIYELFYDMASSLAMHMPDDHILYLRNYLVDMASTRDKARIMIIGPPFIDRKSVAKAVGFLLKLPVISHCDVTNGDPKVLLYYKFQFMVSSNTTVMNQATSICYKTCDLVQHISTTTIWNNLENTYFSQFHNNPDLLASKFKEFLYSHGMGDIGWILYDFPRNRTEVSALQKIGIRPSHAFQLIPSPQNVAERELWDEKFVGKPVKELSKYMKEYRKRLNGLRPTVKNVLKEVPLHGRGLETIAKNIAILGRQSTHSGGPMLPRVVIIGTRGSFKRTIACSMAQQMGVVHVNMSELIEQALQGDNELSRELRELSSRNIRLYGKLVVAVLEDRLLDYDCLNRGWVLTGFPRDNKDFAILDMFDTPPNRVIFITNNSLEALQRVTNRRINIYTGEYLGKEEVAEMEDMVFREQFVIHPDDELVKVMNEQKEFDENVQGMLDYCKGNCIIVDGTGGLDAITQRVFKATLQASPPGGHRTDNLEQVLSSKGDTNVAGSKTVIKPEKSILAAPGRSKSNLKVAFEPGNQIASVSAKASTHNVTKTVEPNIDVTNPDPQSDSAKSICIQTSISGIKPIPKPAVVLKPLNDLSICPSVTSIFPGNMQTEWRKVRNNLKSYTALPPLKIQKDDKR